MTRRRRRREFLIRDWRWVSQRRDIRWRGEWRRLRRWVYLHGHADRQAGSQIDGGSGYAPIILCEAHWCNKNWTPMAAHCDSHYYYFISILLLEHIILLFVIVGIQTSHSRLQRHCWKRCWCTISLLGCGLWIGWCQNRGGGGCLEAIGYCHEGQ